MFPFTFPTGSLPDELGLFVPAALVVGIIAVLLGGRQGAGSDDRVGMRYVGALSLVTLFVALFAAFVAVQALTDLAVDHKARAEINEKAGQKGDYPPVYPGFGPGGPVTTLSLDPSQTYVFSRNNDANYNTAVASGLAALTAGAVFVYHRRRRMKIVGAHGFAASGAAVVNGTYLQSVKAVAALTVALGAAAAFYGIWQILAPGIAGGVGTVDSGIGQAEGVSTLLSSGALAVAAVLIFLRANNEFERA